MSDEPENLTYDEITSRIIIENDMRAYLGMMTDMEVEGVSPASGSGRNKEPSMRLHDFVKRAWHVLEPKRPFVDNWSIGAVCEHLEAVRAGQIENLVINTPPRCTKSLTVSVFFFAWSWIDWPESRWLYSAYADILATRDSLKSRRLITSEWYRSEFGEPFKLTSDQNLKTRFENDRTGHRIATSVGGVGTGEGGDIIVVDDPHKVQEAESDDVREGVVAWWFETMSSRANDPAHVARVIMMQRVHARDLSGEVIARELGYEHLCLPMEFEVDHPQANVRSGLALPLEANPEEGGEPIQKYTPGKPTKIGFVDPRTRDGELLWEKRFPAESVKALKKSLGSYASAGQLQQRPAPRGGSIFKREWFPIVSVAPREAFRVRYWDKAATQDGGKRTAGVLMAKSYDGIFYVENVVKGQWSAGKRNTVIKQTAATDVEEYGNVVQVWLEQEPAGSGKESAEISIKDLAGYLVHSEPVTGDKVVRAGPFAVQAEAGNVRLVKGMWNAEYLEEIELFPRGEFMDQVDASSGAFNKLALAVVLGNLGLVRVASVKGWGYTAN